MDWSLYGNYFHLKFKVTDYITGTIRLSFGSTLLQDVTSNGTYEFWVNSDISISNYISFISTLTFTGCVEIECVDSYYIPSYNDDWIQIRDIKTDTIQTQAPLGVNIYKDHLIISWSAGFLDEDCYYIKIADPCELWNIYLNPIYTIEFTSGESWTTANDCSYAGCNYPLDVNLIDANCSSAVGNLNMAVVQAGGTGANKIEQSWTLTGIGLGVPSNNCCYRLRIKFGNNAFNSITNFRKITISNGKAGACIFETTTIGSQSFNYINFDCCDPIDEIYIRYELDYPAFATAFVESVCFENIKIYEICTNQTGLYYDTNCFQVLEAGTDDGTKLIKGESLINSFQLGFYFAFNFILQQRLFVKTLAPKYPIDANTYIFSDGSKKITSATKRGKI